MNSYLAIWTTFLKLGVCYLLDLTVFVVCEVGLTVPDDGGGPVDDPNAHNEMNKAILLRTTLLQILNFF